MRLWIQILAILESKSFNPIMSIIGGLCKADTNIGYDLQKQMLCLTLPFVKAFLFLLSVFEYMLVSSGILLLWNKISLYESTLVY